MDKQDKVDRIYLRMAQVWSENSYAIRRQVGCLVVKDRMIISDGYNGTPSGFENVCEEVTGCKDHPEMINGMQCVKVVREDDPYNSDNFTCKKVYYKYPDDCIHCKSAQLTTKPYVLHAEANALTKLAKSHNSSAGATLYVTDEPCMECSKMIIQSGIKRVVFVREYRLHEGTELLKRAGIEVKQIDI